MEVTDSETLWAMAVVATTTSILERDVMARVLAAKVAATKTSLLVAARAVLRDRGYASLSTREVAVAAGVPLSQIHYHFGSKLDLPRFGGELVAHARPAISNWTGLW